MKIAAENIKLSFFNFPISTPMFGIKMRNNPPFEILNKEKFIEKSTLKHKNQYDYDNVIINGNNKKVNLNELI